MDAVVSWVLNNLTQINSIITITNPTDFGDQCSANTLQFRYSNPDPNTNALTATDFFKLIRFIRLWRKLGLSIEQTDEILAALFTPPLATGANDAVNLPLLDAGFKTFLPRIGFLLQIMARLNLNVGNALASLLACWAPIGTNGDNSLYAQMFLSPTLQQQGSSGQIVTVAGAFAEGDVLTTTINGVAIVYRVLGGEATDAIVGKIIEEINATTTIDQTTNLPLNSLIFAFNPPTSQGVISIKSGFTLACALSNGATETYTSAFQSPLAQTATVGGTPVQGEFLITTINGLSISYTVAAGDTASTIAQNIAALLNATTTPDPYSGFPLNKVIVASNVSGEININAVNSGAAFTLNCSLAPAGHYVVSSLTPTSQRATIAGKVNVNDVLTTSINSVVISYTAVNGDTSISVAAKIASLINGTSTLDTMTSLPLNKVVHVVNSENSLVFSAAGSATPFTVICSTTIGSVSYVVDVQNPATADVDIWGAFPVGCVLTTTINGTVLPPYRVVDGDSFGSIATDIVSLINGWTAPDQLTNKPFNAVIAAAYNVKQIIRGPTISWISVVASNPLTALTISVSQSGGIYSSMLRPPPFADDGYGNFLSDGSQTLLSQESALCAAFKLTGAEFALITNELKFLPSSPLTLENVSAVFRFGWLAHTLGFSVEEFRRLRRISGLDPFLPLDPGSIPSVEPPVVRFIRLKQALADVGLRTSQALYLIWNQDISGRAAPPSSDVTAFAFTLRSAFADVEASFTLKDDPDGSIAKGLMTLVYGSTTTDFFFGLLNNSLTTSISYSNLESTMAQPIIDASGGRLSYDDFRKQLTFCGVLDQPTLLAIDTAIGNAPLLLAAVANLSAANNKTIGPIFDAHKELSALYTAYALSKDTPQVKRTALLANFLPTLKAKRKQEQALASITSLAGTDQSFAGALLQDATVLHSAAEATSGAVIDLTSIENEGLSVRFFFSNNLSSPPDVSLDVNGIEGALPAKPGGGPIAGRWTGYVTAPQDGFYDITIVTDPGASVTLAIGESAIRLSSTVNQSVWSNQSPIFLTVGALTSIVLNATSIEDTFSVSWASPGVGLQIIPSRYLYSATLVDHLQATYLRFLKASSLASALSLTANEIALLGTASGFRVNTSDNGSYPADNITFAPSSLNNIVSGSVLVIDSGGSQETVIVTATTATTFSAMTTKPHDGATTPFPIVGQAFPNVGQGWLNFLLNFPDISDPNVPVPATATSLLDVLMALLDFSRIKQAVSPNDERLLMVLQNPSQTLANGGPLALLALTGWASNSLDALLAQFFGNKQLANLSSVENFRRIYDAYGAPGEAGEFQPVKVRLG